MKRITVLGLLSLLLIACNNDSIEISEEKSDDPSQIVADSTRMIFHNADFYAIIETLAQHYNKGVTFIDLMDGNFSGSFNLKHDLDQILTVIESKKICTWRLEGDRIIISGYKPE